ncbi:hypothetical protein CC80DRAFT_533676 [Byssothecium circinans]|uniref:Mid2 domain-containing protein n=1 Tax=Byssothecium circinans TaxID=147558 RepID=A0A6A5U1D0_9PLEO|nr:hypothetical protein CC80DRAFT_533676 [Byssothecium circinans]
MTTPTTPRPADCTQDPSYTLDTSLCWSLPASSYANKYGQTTWPRDFNIRTGTESPTPFAYFNSATTTKFDKCRPGPRSCDHTYTGAPCPAGNTAMSVDAILGRTTEFCCPKASALGGAMVIRLGSADETEAPTSTTASLVHCMYMLDDKKSLLNMDTEALAGSSAPTESVKNRNLLYIRAFTAVYSTLPSPTATPGLASSLPVTAANVPVTSIIGNSTASGGVSSTPSQIPTTSGLGVGAKAGIGVVVGIAAVVAIVGFLFLRRFQQRKRQEKGRSMSTFEKAELPASDKPKVHHEVFEMAAREDVLPRQEIDANGELKFLEAPGATAAVELSTANGPVEMYAASRPVEIGSGR